MYENPSAPKNTLGVEVTDDGNTLLIYTNDGCHNSNKLSYASLKSFPSNP